QGRGLATEAVRGMVRLAMGPGRVRRLTTRVFAPAVASSRLLARLGFTHEGTERAAVLAPDGTWWDDQWWSLLREEWQERAPGRRCDAGEGPTGALLWKAWWAEAVRRAPGSGRRARPGCPRPPSAPGPWT